ncbi:hypothetical protein GYMLUDRAFT_37716, partial [Collybiopsis luxurians FD-317 M1]
MLRPAAICTRPLSSLYSLERGRNLRALCSLSTRSTFWLSRSECYPEAGKRAFFISHKSQNLSSTSSPSATHPHTVLSPDNNDANLIYDGPLTSTFRRLKTFSLASLALSTSFAPLIFIIESQLPFFARSCLAFLAVGTSGISTALVAWVSRPYVTTLRRLDPISNGGSHGLELVTSTWRLQSRITRVYDPSFLTTTTRPFAKWQLADEITLPSSSAAETSARPQETAAETFDSNGNLVGSWVVTWEPESATGSRGEGEKEGAGGVKGKCRAVGSVVRYFQVHPELFETS